MKRRFFNKSENAEIHSILSSHYIVSGIKNETTLRIINKKDWVRLFKNTHGEKLINNLINMNVMSGAMSKPLKILTIYFPKEMEPFLEELIFQPSIFYCLFLRAFLRVSLSEYSSSVPVESPRPSEETLIPDLSAKSFISPRT